MRVAALSLSGLLRDNLERYREDLLKLLQLLQVRLAVLPAHTAFLLAQSTGYLKRQPDFVRALALFADKSSEWNSHFLSLHSAMAAELGLFLVAGSTLELTEAGCYHTAYCFGPGGAICASQRQTHLSRDERAMGLSRGTELPLFQIDGMAAGLVVSTDARHPEVGRILSLQGADILIHTGALETNPSNTVQQRAGMWAQVQQNQCWVVEAQLHTETGDFTFSGECAVIGPCEVTADLSGYLARGPAGVSAVSAELPEIKRIELKKRFNLLHQLNPEAYLNKM